MWRFCSFALCATALWLPATSRSSVPAPALGTRTGEILTIDGLRFRDLNHNGHLDPYEDWRLSPEARTADLLQRLSLGEAAGLLVHGSLQDAGFYRLPGTPITPGEKASYNFDRARQWILSQHVTSFVTRLNGTAGEMAEANNRIQEIAEGSPFGIPVTISCDPMRHEENLMREASERDRAFSLWPEPLGFAAIGDPALCRHFGDNVTCFSRPIVACSANLISFHDLPASDIRYNSSSSSPPSRRPVVGVMNFSCPNTGGYETRCQFRPPSEVLNKSEKLKAVLEFWHTGSQPCCYPQRNY